MNNAECKVLNCGANDGAVVTAPTAVRHNVGQGQALYEKVSKN